MTQTQPGILVVTRAVITKMTIAILKRISIGRKPESSSCMAKEARHPDMRNAWKAVAASVESRLSHCQRKKQENGRKRTLPLKNVRDFGELVKNKRDFARKRFYTMKGDTDMRPLREVYSDITNLKCRKEIQKVYDVVRDRYQVFAKKAQEIVEDTQMSMMLDRMQELVQQGKMMNMLSKEEVMEESQKRLDKECTQELAAVREANTEFMRVWGKALLEYPEESVRICQLGWNVGEELKRNDIQYLNKEKMWNGPDTE